MTAIVCVNFRRRWRCGCVKTTESPGRQSRLAVRVGERRFLLNLDDVSEVAPVGEMTAGTAHATVVSRRDQCSRHAVRGQRHGGMAQATSYF